MKTPRLNHKKVKCTGTKKDNTDGRWIYNLPELVVKLKNEFKTTQDFDSNTSSVSSVGYNPCPRYYAWWQKQSDERLMSCSWEEQNLTGRCTL